MDAVQAVAEPRRREILRLVWDTELSAGDIAERFDVTFGAVSQHLKVLSDAGLVTLRQDGSKRFYRADREGMGPLADYLQSMWATRLDALAELAEPAERAEKSRGGKPVSTTSTLSRRCERRIAARPETVFSFFTDREQMAVLDGPGRRVQLPARRRLPHHRQRPQHRRGRFVEVDPPKRLVFTWGWEDGDSVSRPARRPSRSPSNPTPRARCSAWSTVTCPPRRPARPTRTAGSTTPTGSPPSRRAATPAPTPGRDAAQSRRHPRRVNASLGALLSGAGAFGVGVIA